MAHGRLVHCSHRQRQRCANSSRAGEARRRPRRRGSIGTRPQTARHAGDQIRATREGRAAQRSKAAALNRRGGEPKLEAGGANRTSATARGRNRPPPKETSWADITFQSFHCAWRRLTRKRKNKRDQVAPPLHRVRRSRATQEQLARLPWINQRFST